ncbi:hypothetical protein JK359_33350 [Streptomyces actinomycinicus]|uniref:Uncharacterized protein n=1 Tax=Streptomyces actinomycinicus TaxID=1695166 RepID=A0A937ERP7_9ACTN|nr:hypothetical protein [Streptomyces actinomycinicus]MBL1086794.1 hypothetical protein [Streptomyces actinomycinicus]
MSAATTTSTRTKLSAPQLTVIQAQALVTTWLITGFVAFGVAWGLGLQAAWWHRVLLALPVLGLGVADAYGVDHVMDFRARLTRTLADLGWVQIPLAIGGGAWLLGLVPVVGTRLVVGGLIVLVAVLYRYAPHAAAPAGGAR